MGEEKKATSVFEEADIPEEIKNIILNNKEFSKSKIFGQKDLGSPDEIELMNIVLSDNKKLEFKYFNKGIYYMMHGGEKERPIFQVFTHFMTNGRS